MLLELVAVGAVPCSFSVRGSWFLVRGPFGVPCSRCLARV